MGRTKKTTRQMIFVFIVVLVVVLAGAGLGFMFTIGNLKSGYEKKLSEKEDIIESNRRSIYKAKIDIDRGTVISADNVELVLELSGEDKTLLLSGDDLGKTAVVDIKAGQYVTKNMVTDMSEVGDLREAQFSCIDLSKNLYGNDSVDVRISYPNGEDYVVIAKREVRTGKSGTFDGSCYMWLTEEEILRMSAAIVDAAGYEGSRLYTVKYIEPSVQKESETTYIPSVQVIDLINKDPNVIEKSSRFLSETLRKELENRLYEDSKTDAEDRHYEVNSDKQDENPGYFD